MITPRQAQQQTEVWLQRTWRPAIGICYIVINVFDFIIFPIIWSITGMYTGNTAQWKPMTLESAGLFHIAFGAILGVAAFSRGVEKAQRRYSYSGYDDDNGSDDNRPNYPRLEPPDRYRSECQDRPRRIPPAIPSRMRNDDGSQEPSSVFRGEQNQ